MHKNTTFVITYTFCLHSRNDKNGRIAVSNYSAPLGMSSYQIITSVEVKNS